MPNMLTAREVAQRLNVSRSTVYNLATSGALESHRLGAGTVRPRGLRIPESSVSAYLAASRGASRHVPVATDPLPRVA